jgi:hypothetical protein
MAAALRAKLHGAGADDAHGQHEHGYQNFNERKSVDPGPPHRYLRRLSRLAPLPPHRVR